MMQACIVSEILEMAFLLVHVREGEISLRMMLANCNCGFLISIYIEKKLSENKKPQAALLLRDFFSVH